ncbi:30S ribosome-binding factor RbfA [Mycoplasmopsis bovirhinis]|uniref:Ribosome-binding factor A n=1 Tax=Mycoplasmopsis bovirhinis TaxID=29553 RepID=A0A449ACT0_9BACT|nr:30S ribosome-binding factor RbfA [Mycoplasmopsis bovirhinis]VEU62829.1 Ribosome-binding factor A [Mycoplasmopsis bovirhinis]
MNLINLRKKENQIQQLIASILAYDLDNVNIINPVVMEAKLSSDLSLVKVYVNFEKNEKKGIIALNNASGFVRKLLAKSLDWRKVPEVRFYLDTVSKTGSQIDKILQQLKDENNE